MDNNLYIIQATTPEHINSVSNLLEEYADWLNIDLCFQNFAEELAQLPGYYAPPSGCLLLAIRNNSPVGCAALRCWENNIAEMKRLYVRAEFRHQGIGRLLSERIISEARNIGYQYIRLDTLESMPAARQLYRALGFYEIAPYYINPHANVMHLELRLPS
jgi:ribosomal protein S18 acetylase RimI-like enzyme